MTTSIQTIPFHNQNLLATIVDGIPHVAMKPICENIGIDWSAQAQKIKRHPILSKGMVIITTPSKGGIQEMLMLPLRMLNGWLFLIDSNRVKPEVKNKVLEYQEECFEVLANHFMPKRNALVDIPQERKTLQSKKGGLTLEQQDTIKNIVRSTAEALPKDKRAGITIKMWSAIKKKFDLGKGQTYKDVPEEEFNNVISLLARLPLDGELLPKAKEEAKEETQDNSITLTLKPLVNNKHRRVLVTQAKDFMVTLWELDDDQQVLTEQTAIRELESLGYVVFKNTNSGVRNMVFSYLPSDKLPILIQMAGHRLGIIQYQS